MLRSSSVPVPLRVLALFIVVSALVLATLAPALADQHPAAADGQRLEDQSADVQALYRAVYGGDAEARWIAEHNAAIGASMMGDSMMMADSMDMMSNMYYDRLVAVAMARGADADLANRIAADVIGRGTEAAFLAGTDTGVLYGVGTSEADITSPPAPAPAASSGGGGGADPAPASGTGLYAGVDAPADQVYVAGQAIPAFTALDEVPTDNAKTPAQGYGPVAYSWEPMSWNGLSSDAGARTLSGTPTTVGSQMFTLTAKQEDATPDAGEDLPDVMGSLSFQVTVEYDLQPTLADSADLNVHVYAGSSEQVSRALPSATGGNGSLSYSVLSDPADSSSATTVPSWLHYDAMARVLVTTAGGIPAAANDGDDVTYTVTDADGDIASITINARVFAMPAVTQDDVTWVVGTTVSETLTAGTGGIPDGDLTYSVTGLPPGVEFNAETRVISGEVTLPEGTTLTYMATVTVEDGRGSTASDDFTITVNPA